MNENTLLDYLKKELAREIETRAASLSSGSAQSFEEYKHVAGVIRGLALATEIVNDLVQRLEKSDE
jgi:hypothetical protein